VTRVGAVEILRSFDHDKFLEVIMKTGSSSASAEAVARRYTRAGKGEDIVPQLCEGDLRVPPNANSISTAVAAFNGCVKYFFDLPVRQMSGTSGRAMIVEIGLLVRFG